METPFFKGRLGEKNGFVAECFLWGKFFAGAPATPPLRCQPFVVQGK